MVSDCPFKRKGLPLPHQPQELQDDMGDKSMSRGCCSQASSIINVGTVLMTVWMGSADLRIPSLESEQRKRPPGVGRSLPLALEELGLRIKRQNIDPQLSIPVAVYPPMILCLLIHISYFTVRNVFLYCDPVQKCVRNENFKEEYILLVFMKK
jgi:hypothetical protein